MKASEIPFKAKPDGEKRRIFLVRGENEYSLEILPEGITFYVSRVRRKDGDLHGELSVRLTNGHFPNVYTIDGVISAADMNFSSDTARGTRAKRLKDRVGSAGEHLDWAGFVEELSIRSINVEREGDPAVVLGDVATHPDDEDSWVFDGFPVLRRHPTVLFGKGASGKSYLAMWIAGQLGNLDVPVLYLDWELAGDDHAKRLNRLFQPFPKNVYYVLCRNPLREQIDRIQRLLVQHKCQYAVFDSVGPASRMGGRFTEGDLGQEYFGLVRRFGIGTLHVAHPPKNVEDEKESTIYGSAFFGYLARSVWFVQAAENNPHGEISIGLFHHKLTTGAKLKPLAYKILFEGDRTRVQATDLKANDELAAKLPVKDRMQRALRKGAMSVKALAEATDSTPAVVRKMVSRYTTVFTRMGDKVGLAYTAEEKVDF